MFRSHSRHQGRILSHYWIFLSTSSSGHTVPVPTGSESQIHLIQTVLEQIFPFHLLHLSPMKNNTNQQNCVRFSSVASLWHIMRKQVPRKGSQAAVARLEHKSSKCSNFLLLGRRHWRITSWEWSPRQRAKEWAGRHRALTAADCPFLILAQGTHQETSICC